MSDGPRTPWPIRLALAAFPRAFRDAHAAEMEEDYAEARSTCETRAARALLVMRTVVDLIGSGLRERRRVARSSSPTRADVGARPSARLTTMDYLVGCIRSDFHYIITSMRRRPGLPAAGIAILAVAIAANTAVFSVLYPILLRPLPFPDADRLVWMTTAVPALDAEVVSGPDFLDWQAENRTLAALGAYDITFINMSTRDAARRLRVAKVSEQFFSTLRVQPVIGRAFVSEDFIDEGQRVVVLGYELWRSQFNGSPEIVGRTVSLNDENAVVVGVMPPAAQVVTTAEAWEPLPLSRATERRDGQMTFLSVIGRLKDGVSLEQARADMQAIHDRLAALWPDTPMFFRMTPLQQELVKDSSMTLLMLQVAGTILLLITCANLGGLQLARATTRLHEFAVRLAVGSSHAGLVRLMIVENVVIAIVGGAVGLAVGSTVVGPLVRLLPVGSMARLDLGLTWRVVAFAIVLAFAAASVSSIAPLLLLRGRGLVFHIRPTEVSPQASGHHRFRTVLTIAQFALVLALIVGAALATRTLQQLQRVRLGFDPRSLQTLTVTLTPGQYPTVERQRAFFDTALERVRALPAVEAAAVTTSLPLTGFATRGQFYRENWPWERSPEPVVGRRAISPSYFETMGIPLRRGRLFTDLDDARAARVVLINETMARLYFADRDPIGLRITEGGQAPWMTIIAVVGDVRQVGIDEELKPEMFVPHRQYRAVDAMSLVVRTSVDPSNLRRSITAAVRSVDPTQPIHDVRTMEEHLSEALLPWRSRMVLIGTLGAIALGLAGAGLYGLIGYLVSVRRKEFGVRMALGADPGQILRSVFGYSVRLVLISLPLGLALAYAFARGMSTLLFGVKTLDPSSFAVAAGVLSVITIVATCVPAYRAAIIDPSTMLKTL